jgi:nucleoside 2-deoxyribosyltransferase
MKVYLAGPDVFFPDAMAIGRRKQEICARFGLIGLFPLDSGILDHGTNDSASGVPPSVHIFRGCISMMEEADAVIAHLTPFRGASADAGTVFELGYMAARGKICVGYTNKCDSYADRMGCAPEAVPAAQSALHPEAAFGGGLANLDCKGHVIEDFGLADNLMIVHALDAFGHPMLVPDVEPEDIWRDLKLFERCAAWIAGKR